MLRRRRAIGWLLLVVVSSRFLLLLPTSCLLLEVRLDGVQRDIVPSALGLVRGQSESVHEVASGLQGSRSGQHLT